MAQLAAKRLRRTGGRAAFLGRGLLVSIGITGIAVLIFAVILGFTDWSDQVIRILNQVIKVGAICLGVRAAVQRGAENGIRRGALLGLLYMGLGVLLYALLARQELTLRGYLLDLLMGLAAGGLSGMLWSSLPKKEK